MQTHTRRRARVPREARVFAQPARGRPPGSASRSRQSPPRGNDNRSTGRCAKCSQDTMTRVHPPSGCVALEPMRRRFVSRTTRRRSSRSRAPHRRRDPHDRTRRLSRLQNEAAPPKRAAAWTCQRLALRRLLPLLPRRRRDQLSEALRQSRCTPLHRRRTAF